MALDTSFVAYILSDETIHPNNTLNEFIVRLPSHYNFNRDYEVALIRADIPNQIYNIREGNYFKIKYAAKDNDGVSKYIFCELSITPGYYSNYLELKEALRTSFDNYYEGHPKNPWNLLKRRKRRAMQDLYPHVRVKRFLDIEPNFLNPFDIIKNIDHAFRGYFMLSENILESVRTKYESQLTWPLFFSAIRRRLDDLKKIYNNDKINSFIQRLLLKLQVITYRKYRNVRTLYMKLTKIIMEEARQEFFLGLENPKLPKYEQFYLGIMRELMSAYILLARYSNDDYKLISKKKLNIKNIFTPLVRVRGGRTNQNDNTIREVLNIITDEIDISHDKKIRPGLDVLGVVYDYFQEKFRIIKNKKYLLLEETYDEENLSKPII